MAINHDIGYDTVSFDAGKCSKYSHEAYSAEGIHVDTDVGFQLLAGLT